MSKKKTQKVLIPKGTINADEDTLIEIPVSLKNQAVVIAKRTDDGYQRNVTNTNSSKSVKSCRTIEDEDPVIFSDTIRYQTNIKEQPKRNEVFSPSYSSTFYESASSNHSYNNTGPKPSLAQLNETEQAERISIQRKLEEFQQARRQLLLETNTVATKSSQLIPQTTFAPQRSSSPTSAYSSHHTPPTNSRTSSRGRIKPSRGIINDDDDDDDDAEDLTPIPAKKSSKNTAKNDADVLFGPKKSSCTRPPVTTANNLTEEVQSLYVRPCSASRRPIVQDSGNIVNKQNAASSHRKYEKKKSTQCRPMQTESYPVDDEEEEEDCLCLSRSASTHSGSKSSNGVLYSVKKR